MFTFITGSKRNVVKYQNKLIDIRCNIMLPLSDMHPLQDEAVTIEPQYDGVIMLSSESVLFSDAKPRPDGSKVYHVFERTLGEPAQDEVLQNEDFQTRQEQLFSQAHENTLQGIQQVRYNCVFRNVTLIIQQ